MARRDHSGSFRSRSKGLTAIGVASALGLVVAFGAAAHTVSDRAPIADRSTVAAHEFPSTRAYHAAADRLQHALDQVLPR